MKVNQNEKIYYFTRKNEIKEKYGLEKYFNQCEKEETKELIRVAVPKNFVSSNFIALFNKPSGNIVCPHFWEFKPFIGCPFNCSYCYLQGTFYGNKSPRIKDVEKMVKELDSFLSWANSFGLRLLLNAGELADSLAVREWTELLINSVLPVLRKHREHKILLLTKGGTQHIEPLLNYAGKDDLKRFFIVSFSLNPDRVSRRYENGAACPEDRLKAAKILQDEGFIIRIRIDPIIPISGYRADYAGLIKEMLVDYELTPERITLGSLRGLNKTIKFAKDRRWLKYLDKSERTEWGLKVNKELRLELYSFIIKKMLNAGYTGFIALCKETLEIWKKLSNLGLIEDPGTTGIWENVNCNCKL